MSPMGRDIFIKRRFLNIAIFRSNMLYSKACEISTNNNLEQPAYSKACEISTNSNLLITHIQLLQTFGGIQVYFHSQY
jgi:hypothetical protein